MDLNQHACLRVSIAVKRHHEHGSSYEGNNLEWLPVSRIKFITFMEGHGSMQDMLMSQHALW